MTATATNAWSIINVMRRSGATTKADVLAAWIAVENVPGNVTLPVSNDMDDGLSYLTINGIVSFDGTNITPIHTDSEGKPSRMRRVAGDETRLEYLPEGATPTDGT